MKTYFVSLLTLLSSITLNANTTVIDRIVITTQLQNIEDIYTEKNAIICKDIQHKSKEAGFHKGVALANHWLGSYFLNKGKVDTAFIFIQKVLEIGRTTNDSLVIGRGLIECGAIFNRMEAYEKARTSILEGLAFSKAVRDEKTIGIGLNNLGNSYGRQGNFEEGIRYLEAARTIMKKIDNKERYQIGNFNLALTYQAKDQPEIALPYAFAFLDYYRLQNNDLELAYGHELIGSLCLDLKSYDEALFHLDSALQVGLLLNAKSIISGTYKDISLAYEGKGDLKNSLSYFKLHQVVKEEYLGADIKNNVALLEHQLELEKKEKRQLRSQQEISHLEVNQQRLLLLIFGLLASLIIGLLLFLKNQKAQEFKDISKQLLESELKYKELEAQKLQGQLIHKEADLTDLALDIARKNTFSKALLPKIENLKNINSDQLQVELRQLSSFLNNHLKINDDLAYLQNNVDKVNHEFYQKLEGRFGKLTTNEKYLAGLLRLNLSNKDIAALRNISVGSAKMNRHRFKKKLGLDGETSIVQFLQEI